MTEHVSSTSITTLCSVTGVNRVSFRLHHLIIICCIFVFTFIYSPEFISCHSWGIKFTFLRIIYFFKLKRLILKVNIYQFIQVMTPVSFEVGGIITSTCTSRCIFISSIHVLYTSMIKFTSFLADLTFLLILCLHLSL